MNDIFFFHQTFFFNPFFFSVMKFKDSFDVYLNEEWPPHFDSSSSSFNFHPFLELKTLKGLLICDLALSLLLCLFPVFGCLKIKKNKQKPSSSFNEIDQTEPQPLLDASEGSLRLIPVCFYIVLHIKNDYVFL